MHGTVALIFVFLELVTGGHEVNYCGAKMCGYTNAHTFCQFSYGPSPSCTGLIPALLTAEEKSRILARLNRRRNDAASGRLTGMPSAGNMLKLRWVEELAREAQLWADQCRPQRTPEEHDACRDLYSISVGQCVASVVGESPGLKVESMVDIWFMQSKFYKGNVTLYEPSYSNKHDYGDFAQMMWARTFMVGCGRSRFMLPVNGRLRTIERLVCNFAPQGPIPYRNLWTLGAPATACPSRSRPCGVLTSLCDYQKELNQPKDIDASMTIEDHILLNALLEIERNETLFEGSLDEIYLTYLAIVTMESTEATPSHYNSMQKRDIVERIVIEDDKIEVTRQSTLETMQDITTKPVTTKSVQKLKTVGRPKAYRIEELSDTDGNQKDKNRKVNEAVSSKRQKDFYYDYVLELEELDENVTTTTERIILKKDSDENVSFEDHTFEIIPMTMKTRIIVAVSDETKFTTDGKIDTENYRLQPNNYSKITATVSKAKENAMDDYLNDPETVHQLQEALDRVEHEASRAAGSESTTRKMRRDIQDIESSNEQDPPYDLPSTPVLADPQFSLLPDIDITKRDENSSSETPPVLSIMMKYMPYLKHYENEILGPKNSAGSVCPSVIFPIVILCNVF